MADQSSKLLINEPALQVLPSLAVVVGLNEAIILQQIQYWMTNGKTGHVKDGRKWIYNSYEEWQQQFPFWSLNTIRRAIDNLEKKGVLMIDAFNQSSFDRTRWYSIDYDKLNSLPLKDGESKSNKRTQSPKMGRSKRPSKTDSKVGDGTAQNGQIEQAKMGKSLPETTLPETTTEITNTQKATPSGVPTIQQQAMANVEPGATNLAVDSSGNGQPPSLKVSPARPASLSPVSADKQIELAARQQAKQASSATKRSVKPKKQADSEPEDDLEGKLMQLAIWKVTGLDFRIIKSVRETARKLRKFGYVAEDAAKARQICVKTDWRWTDPKRGNPGRRMTLQDVENYIGQTKTETNAFQFDPEMELNKVIRRIRTSGDFNAVDPDYVPALPAGDIPQLEAPGRGLPTVRSGVGVERDAAQETA